MTFCREDFIEGSSNRVIGFWHSQGTVLAVLKRWWRLCCSGYKITGNYRQ